MELAIKLKNIQQSFGAKEVLNIPELAIYQNDRIGIIGDNGTGKSTLLRLLIFVTILNKRHCQRIWRT